MNIIIDLDGTLIDSKVRLYNLFIHLCPELRISYEEYWNYKLNKISNVQILERALSAEPAFRESFISRWMELIEEDHYLDNDVPFEGIASALGRLQVDASLHLCTARQFEDKAIAQLERFNLLQYFDQILVTRQTRTKFDLIKSNIDLHADDWLIGDTGRDIETGKALGIKTCAVTSGFLSEEMLKAYSPDLLINSFTEFKL